MNYTVPREPKVGHNEALNAICKHGNELIAIVAAENKLPDRSSTFYKNVSKTLNEKWKPQDIYRNLREDRKSLKTQAFQKLGIVVPPTTASVFDNILNFNVEEFIAVDESDESEVEDESVIRNISFTENNNTFQLIIYHGDYEKMQPTTRVYNGRETLILEPRVWSDIINDRFFELYKLPCAYTFKKATVSRNPDNNFIRIVGVCKSKLCNSPFYATAEEEPCAGGNLILKVQTRDTSDCQNHEQIKRQLRHHKREMIGQQVVAAGASNVRRELARKELPLGVGNSATVYSLPVLRKLKQETENKNLGLTAADAENTILTLVKMKFTPPYAGTIRVVSYHEFFMIYIMPDQIALLKEYSRLNKNSSQLSFDSTAGLVHPIRIDDLIPPSGHVFLHEIVINFNGMTVPVGQMLSAAQDTATIEYFLRKFLQAGAPIPKTVVSDYGRAVLNAVCLAFNNKSLKEYVAECFQALHNNTANRPAATFIRIDVAHFIAMLCRAKCFNKDNSAVKDFLIRGVALLVSCDNFSKFSEILEFLLVITSHKYDGKIKNTNLPTPAETARKKLCQYISSEEHKIVKVIPDENSDEFKTIVLKLEVSGRNDPKNKEYLFNQSATLNPTINQWISRLTEASDVDKDIEGSFVNGYRLPSFREKLIFLAKECPLWSGLMTSSFNCNQIRATSASSEGQFNELKNRILRNPAGRIGIHKFFIIHFRAILGSVQLAFCDLVNKRKFLSDECKKDLDELETGNLKDVLGAENNIEISDETLPDIEKSVSEVSSENELLYVENWRGKAEKNHPILMKRITDLPPQKKDSEQVKNHDERLEVNNDRIDEELAIIANWKPENVKNNSLPRRDSMQLKEKSGRKRSKFFRPYPQIAAVDPTKLTMLNTQKKVDMFLINGNKFEKPLQVQKGQVILRNTCGPDSIFTILGIGAKDCEYYLKHLEDSKNETCRFILTFIELGAVSPVYIRRCQLLMDFVDTTQTSSMRPIINNKVFNSHSPIQRRRIVDVFSNATLMWEYLMKHEPSIRKITICKEGHQAVLEIPTLFVNLEIIMAEGFQALESAILWTGNSKRTCAEISCKNSAQESILLNAHLFIELDLKKITENEKTGQTEVFTMSCVPTDFPLHMNVMNQKFRLAGIIVYYPNHYAALCRRTSGRWEIYNDLWKRKKDYKVSGPQESPIIPAAVIYIRE